MVSDTVYWTFAVIRTFIVGGGIYLIGIWVRKLKGYPFKNAFFRKLWDWDTAGRKWVLKNYWLLGIITFVIHVIYDYFWR